MVISLESHKEPEIVVEHRQCNCFLFFFVIIEMNIIKVSPSENQQAKKTDFIIFVKSTTCDLALYECFKSVQYILYSQSYIHVTISQVVFCKLSIH